MKIRRGRAPDVKHQPSGTRLVHSGHFYTTPDELLQVSAEFVRTGLRQGEPVLVVQPQPQLERLAEVVGEAENVTYVDMRQDGRNPGRILPWVMHSFTQRHAGRPVRIVGEPMWPGRTALEYPACLQHEALVNFALRDTPVNVMCAYDITGLTVQTLRDARLTHPMTMNRTGALHETAGFDEEDLKALLDQQLPSPPGDAVSLSFRGSALRLVRQLVNSTARANGIAGETLQAFTFAVNEAATNAIRHGGGKGALQLWTEDGHLVCDVHSQVPLADPAAGRLRPDPVGSAGRGLPMINYVCDLVRWSRGPEGTHVRMWMRLHD
jgi:anti-sigma regulatory factor (Ser/Thr protein kinase)